jgi:AcrR family transcriptional regulator
MSAGSFPVPPLDPLPSGRHRLSREAVQQSQRGRLLFAIVQIVSDKGYGATTVADIVERASVSRTTFYEQFPDKEACFLAAFDYGVEFVLGQMRDAWAELEGERDWRAHVRSDLSTFLRVLASEPAFASALHIEVLAAGAAALERRHQIIALFTERTRRLHELARAEDPSVPALPATVFELHSGGLDELIRECVRTRGADALGELIEPAVRATLAMLGGRPPGALE